MSSVNLVDELTCPICLELYDCPVSLPCLHSFCTECLQNLTHSSGGTTVTCPQCRIDAQVPAGGVKKFPKNFHLANIVQKVKQHNEQKESSEMKNKDAQNDHSDMREQTQESSEHPSSYDFVPHYPPRFKHPHGPPWRHHPPPPPGCHGRGPHPPPPPHGPHPRHPGGPHGRHRPPRHHHGHPRHHPPPWHHFRGPPPPE
ncbi:uncharacterized protein LOC133186150 [Saccostrea echinata]|uniref:uncharacterized protein LOC133186150 n=1 Tax=Saccostrea echinata TaxID=191078 RepID=UPI002A7F7DB0|nr:uncharacterized protein LOC133186150 [Saccostrea echinata]